MKIEKVLKAEKEAKRFIESINNLKKRIKKEQGFIKIGYISGCAETGAVKRSSMDLTRSLANLRKH